MMFRACAALAGIALVGGGAHAAPNPVDQAYGHFTHQNYQAAYDILKPYRSAHAPSLRVDFMIAVSACRLGYGAWGLGELKVILATYSTSLTPQAKSDVFTQIQLCQPSSTPTPYIFSGPVAPIAGVGTMAYAPPPPGDPFSAYGNAFAAYRAAPYGTPDYQQPGGIYTKGFSKNFDSQFGW